MEVSLNAISSDGHHYLAQRQDSSIRDLKSSVGRYVGVEIDIHIIDDTEQVLDFLPARRMLVDPAVSQPKL